MLEVQVDYVRGGYFMAQTSYNLDVGSTDMGTATAA